MSTIPRRITASVALMLLAAAAGCQAVAPIHVWSPARLESGVGKRVAIAPLGGDPKVAKPLHVAMLRQQPRQPGLAVVALDAQALQGDADIRLVSAESGAPSDIAMFNLARRAACDFLLLGEVVQTTADQHRSSPYDQPLDLEGPSPAIDHVRVPGRDPMLPTDWPSYGPAETVLRVSWNLVDCRRQLPPSGQPVVTRRSAQQPLDETITEAARDAWQLLVPFVTRDQAQLSAPRLALGAATIRRGNAAAAAGDWPQAERLWKQVFKRHPRNHAAMHNLAVAALARQDFTASRHWIAEAISIKSAPLYNTTAVWIEQRQRDYHVAFELPDPPGGWAATRQRPAAPERHGASRAGR